MKKKLLNIITSRFFCVFEKQKEIQQNSIMLAKANGQSTTCPKETAKLVVELFASFFTRQKACLFL